MPSFFCSYSCSTETRALLISSARGIWFRSIRRTFCWSILTRKSGRVHSHRSCKSISLTANPEIRKPPGTAVTRTPLSDIIISSGNHIWKQDLGLCSPRPGIGSRARHEARCPIRSASSIRPPACDIGAYTGRWSAPRTAAY